MGVGPRKVTLAQPATPPRYGLVGEIRLARVLEGQKLIDEAKAVAAVEGNAYQAGDERRWENGFTWAPENCTDAKIYDPCLETARTISSNQATLTFDPFEIEAGDKCSPFAFKTRDWVGRATRTLLACQTKAVEKEFWKGTQATASSWSNKFLASSEAHIIGYDMGVVQAMACLERALADVSCGTRGMIHCTRDLFTRWVAERLVSVKDGIPQTELGTIVVGGTGYDGSSPAGAPQISGHCWAYATGMVDVRLGEIAVIPTDSADLNELINQAISNQNLVEIRAQRMAAATWDNCAHIAIEVDISACGIGS